MNFERISKNVSFDGQKYFCDKCGLTFEREMQARGHLSSCPSRTIARGIMPQAPPPAPLAPLFSLPVDVVVPCLLYTSPSPRD